MHTIINIETLVSEIQVKFVSDVYELKIAERNFIKNIQSQIFLHGT